MDKRKNSLRGPLAFQQDTLPDNDCQETCCGETDFGQGRTLTKSTIIIIIDCRQWLFWSFAILSMNLSNLAVEWIYLVLFAKTTEEDRLTANDKNTTSHRDGE